MPAIINLRVTAPIDKNNKKCIIIGVVITNKHINNKNKKRSSTNDGTNQKWAVLRIHVE